jgi:hypothetical protein
MTPRRRRRGRTPQPFLQTRSGAGPKRRWRSSDPRPAEAGRGKRRLIGPGDDRHGGGGAVEAAGPPAADAAKDRSAAAARNARGVIGDSDFASNAYLGGEGNRDLFMNVVAGCRSRRT